MSKANWRSFFRSFVDWPIRCYHPCFSLLRSSNPSFSRFSSSLVRLRTHKPSCASRLEGSAVLLVSCWLPASTLPPGRSGSFAPGIASASDK